jgi:dolichyl-diphosphooligosaccharide--protein glycosyltransferase
LLDIHYVTGKPPGYDRVRSAEIGNKDFELDVLEEAYTTEHWLVRIYKVCSGQHEDSVSVRIFITNSN